MVKKSTQENFFNGFQKQIERLKRAFRFVVLLPSKMIYQPTASDNGEFITKIVKKKEYFLFENTNSKGNYINTLPIDNSLVSYKLFYLTELYNKMASIKSDHLEDQRNCMADFLNTHKDFFELINAHRNWQFSRKPETRTTKFLKSHDLWPKFDCKNMDALDKQYLLISSQRLLSSPFVEKNYGLKEFLNPLIECLTKKNLTKDNDLSADLKQVIENCELFTLNLILKQEKSSLLRFFSKEPPIITFLKKYNLLEVIKTTIKEQKNKADQGNTFGHPPQ